MIMNTTHNSRKFIIFNSAVFNLFIFLATGINVLFMSFFSKNKNIVSLFRRQYLFYLFNIKLIA